MELKLKKGTSGGHLPTKRSVNLAMVGVERISAKSAVPGLIIVAVLVILFAKFGVADRLIALNNAEREASKVETKINEGYAMIDSYAGLEEDYAHYTYSGMTPEELGRADRADVIELIARVIQPSDTTNSWELQGDELALTVTGDTLQEINELARRLESDPLVSYCTVTMAETVEVEPEEPEVTLEELLAAVPEAEDEEPGEETEADVVVDINEIVAQVTQQPETYVRASIIVYLTNGTEGVE